MNKIKFLLAGTAAFLSLASVANAGVILNGGFELQSAPDPFYIQSSPPGLAVNDWEVVGGDVLLINEAYVEDQVAFNPHGGEQSLDITGAGNDGSLLRGVTQDVFTQLGRTYALSFFVGRADDTGGAVPKYSTPSTVALSVGGAPLTYYTNSDVTQNGVNWQQFTLSPFAGTGGLVNFAFYNATASLDNGGNNFVGLDDVVLLESAQAVPEPASMAIFGIGAIVVGAGSYRRRRK